MYTFKMSIKNYNNLFINQENKKIQDEEEEDLDSKEYDYPDSESSEDSETNDDYFVEEYDEIERRRIIYISKMCKYLNSNNNDDNSDSEVSEESSDEEGEYNLEDQEMDSGYESNQN